VLDDFAGGHSERRGPFDPAGLASRGKTHEFAAIDKAACPMDYYPVEFRDHILDRVLEVRSGAIQGIPGLLDTLPAAVFGKMPGPKHEVIGTDFLSHGP